MWLHTKDAAASYDVKFYGFHIVFRTSDKMPLVHCAREDLDTHTNVTAEYNTAKKTHLVQECHYLLTLCGHRMCTAKCRGLGCQTIYMTITKPQHSYTCYSWFFYHYWFAWFYYLYISYVSSHRLDHISGLICTTFERAVTAGDIFAGQNRKKSAVFITLI